MLKLLALTCPIFLMIQTLLLILSCVHVFLESKNSRRIGHPWVHTLSCALIAWPLCYLYWIFWWPGTLRQKIFGSDEEQAKTWAKQKLRS